MVTLCGFESVGERCNNCSMFLNVSQQVPTNILIEGDGMARIMLLRPDGRRVVIGPFKIEGKTSFNSNPTITSTIRRFATSMGFTPDDWPFVQPTAMLFMSSPKNVLPGEYVLSIEASSPVAVTVFGSSYGLLGTDNYGRDLWVGFVLASRNTLFLALEVSVFVVMFGLFWAFYLAITITDLQY